ncbi:MAG: hypothetical protein SPiTSB_27830 [Shewanella algae]
MSQSEQILTLRAIPKKTSYDSKGFTCHFYAFLHAFAYKHSVKLPFYFKETQGDFVITAIV